MEADTSTKHADQEQIGMLCDEALARREHLSHEQAVLSQLVTATAPTRPFVSRQYRLLLDTLQEQSSRIEAVIRRYCRRDDS